MFNQYSEQSSSSSQDDQKLVKHQPRFYKHNEMKNTKRLYINLTDCHYQVLSEIAQDLDLRVTTNKTNWDLYWTDHAIEKQHLFRLLDHQKINHYPGMYILARKNCLAKGLMRMRKTRANQYNFFPLTWLLPSQLNQLKVFKEQLGLSEQKQKDKTAFIVKPEASCQGKGIKITLEPQKTTEQCIVQIYISNPYLINGLKFDFRLYVLLAGCDPMRIYLYRQGLARFSTQKYNYQPSKKNLKKTMVHLTNYAVNKNNPKFIFNKNVNDAHTGHKRSYSAVIRALGDLKVDTFKLEQKINQIIVKTIISGQPFLAHMYNLSLPNNYANDMCFQILGFDILIDSNAEPYLLEVNHTPSFVADTPIDHHIKYNLIKDTITLMNITLQSKKQKIQQRQQFTHERQQGKSKKYSLQQKYILKEEEQIKRDWYQNSHMGNYKKIYPTQDKTQMKIYEDLLEVSDGIFRKQNMRTKDRSLPVLKKTRSFIHSNSNILNSRQLPSLKKLRSTEMNSLKLKEPKTSAQLSREIQGAQKHVSANTTYTLQRTKKSMTLHTKYNSPEKNSMVKTLISLKNINKSQLLMNSQKFVSLELAKKLQSTSRSKQGSFLQPKLVKLDNKPSKEPNKGIHYVTPSDQKLPMNYQRYILKQTQSKKKQKKQKQLLKKIKQKQLSKQISQANVEM